MHNDFRRERGIFPLFEGLEVPDLDKHITVPEELKSAVDGAQDVEINGVHDEKADGEKAKEERGAEEQASITPVAQSDWTTPDKQSKSELPDRTKEQRHAN